MTPLTHRTPRALTCIATAAVIGLAGCGGTDSASDASSDSAAGDAGQWPLTITDDADHEVTIDEQPEKIVSTAVTLTGSLLAIDAPVTASGATMPGSPVADDQGFFTQWGDVAKEKDVEALYQGDPDVEAVLAEEPDLILVSKTGQDSANAIYDQLSDIAPTVVVDYGDKDWQEVTTKLGEITEHTDEAKKVNDEFDSRAEEVKSAIDAPKQPVTGMIFNEKAKGGGSGASANVWTPDSAQGKLLEEVGFELAEVPEGTTSQGEMGKRSDIYEVTGENLSKAVTGESVFLFNADEETVDGYKENSLVKGTPAVKNDAVYAMGLDSFRLDYYSATNVLDRIEDEFAK
ncbi:MULTISPECIES: Fe2+-enterobactin ABC transporter substrate-binding protein [unclassified Brevibacterium]|uniref:Fe2+-enterobactin ABC transporter substrate-binding protein n=1 Tax=unclassified Brevibacterium TaxID=2614124 RepID=UPI00109234F3|nr:Fe2+-enterobactin ABC transporter substrate-binding protein [Brevibacterium sp. S22]TGD28465.1 Fe2+-enterobactin ABC transporter substrate-binding protein [Brevibacterium sp. S22]